MLDIFQLEPCLSNLVPVLWVIILLEYGSQLPSLPYIKVLECPKIAVIKDLDIVRPIHDPLNLVKSFHALSSDTPPYYQVTYAMLDVLLCKLRVQSLSRLNLAILVAI
jgi:hypothetical protein